MSPERVAPVRPLRLAPAEAPSRPAPARVRPRRGQGLVVVAMVLVGAAAVGFALWSWLEQDHPGSGGPASARTEVPTGPNLVPNPSFEASTQLVGVADGLAVWGAASPAMVTGPVSDGSLAQRLDVPPGKEGGVFFELPAAPGSRYVQALDAEVLSLAPGARLDLILEFYDAKMSVLGYRVASVREAGTKLVHLAQSATAPRRTSRLRFVVNVAGGGSAVVDHARLGVAT